MEDFINTIRGFISGQNKGGVISPLPQNPPTGDKAPSNLEMELYQHAKQVVPGYKADMPEFLKEYRKYGNKLFELHPEILQMDSKPNVLGDAISQIKQHGGAQAQAPVPSPTLAPDATDFEKTALPILNQYGIPPSVAFGMRDAEGGKIGANNVFNINAVDSNPDAATNFATPEEGVRAFAQLLTTNPRYSQAYQDRGDIRKMIEDIQNAGFAGDPSTWRQRSIQQARQMGKQGAGELYKNYAQFVQNTPGWQKYMNQPKNK